MRLATPTKTSRSASGCGLSSPRLAACPSASSAATRRRCSITHWTPGRGARRLAGRGAGGVRPGRARPGDGACHLRGVSGRRHPRLERDEADRGRRKISCSVLALWAHDGPVANWYDPLEVWRAWADDVQGGPIRSGHFLPEEAPEETYRRLHAFLTAPAEPRPIP